MFSKVHLDYIIWYCHFVRLVKQTSLKYRTGELPTWKELLTCEKWLVGFPVNFQSASALPRNGKPCKLII